MRKLFGTDGIRGVANKPPMTPEIALRVGRAVGEYFQSKGNCIVIGKDTRISGDMLESAIAAGVASSGMAVHLCGVIPTPAISFLTGKNNAACGIVISASHNPYTDNGIKLFGDDGYKLTDQQEIVIEDLVFKETGPEKYMTGIRPGRIQKDITSRDNYLEFLIKSIPNGLSLKGLRVVIDCSNGATYKIAPELFARMGADTICLSIEPDGRNINENCGSEHPETIARTVTKSKADIGIAFDGDGDRLVVVDERGNVLTGDQTIAVCSRYLKESGNLQKNIIITTVMSNIGLGRFLRKYHIECVQSDVGDRYVMQEMKKTGAVLGGENSGHMIFHQYHRTGDGMLAAIQFLAAVRHYAMPVSALAGTMTVFPQETINVNVREKPDIDTIKPLKKCISSVEASLGKEGRVLVRYSGTQPMCRIMVEGPDVDATKKYCEQIAESVRETIGQ